MKSLSKKEANDQVMPDKIYTLGEAADYLGIKPRTLKQWIRDKKITPFKLAGSRKEIRIHEEDLQALIDKSRKGKGGE